jgi:hypothetical protein
MSEVPQPKEKADNLETAGEDRGRSSGDVEEGIWGAEIGHRNYEENESCLSIAKEEEDDEGEEEESQYLMAADDADFERAVKYYSSDVY